MLTFYREVFAFLAKVKLSLPEKYLRSKLHYEVTSLPQGNFTCRYVKLSFGTAWCVFRNTALCGCAEAHSAFIFYILARYSCAKWTATAPSAAAVIICRTALVRTSPIAKTPSTEVFVVSSALIYPFSSVSS